MRATWAIEFRTGSDLTDNDRHRIRELIEEAVAEVASEYFAAYSVSIENFTPGSMPREYEGQLDVSVDDVRPEQEVRPSADYL